MMNKLSCFQTGNKMSIYEITYLLYDKVLRGKGVEMRLYCSLSTTN